MTRSVALGAVYDPTLNGGRGSWPDPPPPPPVPGDKALAAAAETLATVNDHYEDARAAWEQAVGERMAAELVAGRQPILTDGRGSMPATLTPNLGHLDDTITETRGVMDRLGNKLVAARVAHHNASKIVEQQRAALL